MTLMRFKKLITFWRWDVCGDIWTCLRRVWSSIIYSQQNSKSKIRTYMEFESGYDKGKTLLHLAQLSYLYAKEWCMKKGNWDAGSSLYWRVFHLESNKWLWNKYDMCKLHLQDCLFSQMRLTLPINNYKVKVMNHLGISPHNCILWVGLTLKSSNNDMSTEQCPD